MLRQNYRQFTQEEQNTWKLLFSNLSGERRTMIHMNFTYGLELLGLNAEGIPNIHEVNNKLKSLTGWQGVPVEGLEEGDSFYPALAKKEFPIGNFIRSANDINYTPAPDVFHDLYGHLPFLANPEYAEFCQAYGALVSRYLHDSVKKRMFERFFWFGVEFSLVKTDQGTKIFGAGIVSSKGECEYALSSRPNVLPFHVQDIADREFKIDEFQETIYVLESPSQLYGSLLELEEYVLQKH